MRFPNIEVRRRLVAGAAVLALVLVLTELLLLTASFARAPLTVDVGPSTGAYMSGFTDSEEHPPLTFRWARVLAAVEPPLVASGGPATIVIRFARFLDEPTTTHVSLSGVATGSFAVRPGRFRVDRLPVAVSRGLLHLELRTDDTDGSGLGLAIDWIRVEGPRWTLPLSLFAPRLLVAGVFVIAIASGFRAGGAALAALVLGLAQAAWAAVDPFALAHVSSKIVWPALGATALCAAVFRSRGRFVILIFLAG